MASPLYGNFAENYYSLAFVSQGEIYKVTNGSDACDDQRLKAAPKLYTAKLDDHSWKLFSDVLLRTKTDESPTLQHGSTIIKAIGGHDITPWINNAAEFRTAIGFIQSIIERQGKLTAEARA